MNGKSIKDVIAKRYSARNYQAVKIDNTTIDQIKQYGKAIVGPFQEKVRFEIVDQSDINNKDGKIGTYGIIKGAPSYILGFVEKGEHDLEQLGYAFEELILYLTSLELGTCWLGGTFNKKGLLQNITLRENEVLPAITPVGYIKNKKHLLDSAIRLIAGSDKRKSWSEVFFKDSFDMPLEKEEAGNYEAALEMVRIAPSASNKQPWRILKKGDNYHFYLQSTKGYSKTFGYNIQKLDMGIAMCHFELTAKESGEKGFWNKEDNILKQDGMEYIITWTSAK